METKILVITEKSEASTHLRDGGAMVIQTLKNVFGDNLDIVQFDEVSHHSKSNHFTYPISHPNRFVRRILNSDWVAEKVSNLAQGYSHVIFIHVSMLFGVIRERLSGCKIWLFPMLLGESYAIAGEIVPSEYLAAEQKALRNVDRIITPSHFEKQQLCKVYGVPLHITKVIPRGVSSFYDKSNRGLESGPLEICSIGSIKPQKNTLELISLFAHIKKSQTEATLLVVGPIQNASYFLNVQKKVQKLGLETSVTFTGYVTHDELKRIIAKSKFHLSATHCETFGRTIFETLSYGILNLLPNHQNCAALEHLQDSPYCKTYTNKEDLLLAIKELTEEYETRSELASETGKTFNEKRLSQLIRAEILEAPEMLVTDFDGTLFHKDDSVRTNKSVDQAKQYEKLIICSARSVKDIRNQLTHLAIRPDWIVGLSGSEIESFDGQFKVCYPLSDSERNELLNLYPNGIFIMSDGLAVQMRTQHAESSLRFRAEKYDNYTYLHPRRNSKLNAILNILDYLNYSGRIVAWGDGTHDLPYLTYFDGLFMGQNRSHPFLRTETKLNK
jgi:glycosyltransferase involved in cell wall biosynthesis/hydroxymethylpyrimidine pyrophosphatase-like HAD family hydrolase